MVYSCSHCGEVHDDLPDVAFEQPLPALEVPEAERPRRVEASADWCSLDGAHFFIRGVLEIPVHGDDRALGYGVWVSQKRASFEAYRTAGDGTRLPAAFGWLSNRIPGFGVDTFLLKTMAHFRPDGLRPAIVVEPTGHPLARAQHEGIGVPRAWGLVHEALGDGPWPP